MTLYRPIQKNDSSAQHANTEVFHLTFKEEFLKPFLKLTLEIDAKGKLSD